MDKRSITISAAELSKTCSSCGLAKPRTEFSPHARTRDRLRSNCKACNVTASSKWYFKTKEQRREINAKRKRLYHWRKRGVDVEAATALVNGHDGTCDLCGSSSRGTTKDWAVDHCHVTGVVRGILCQGCNTGLGGFRDNPEVLRKAIIYLEAYKNG